MVLFSRLIIFQQSVQAVVRVCARSPVHGVLLDWVTFLVFI